MSTLLLCFKAYDIRGRVPDVLNAPLAHALGRTVAEGQSTNGVVLCCDARLSGTLLRDALANGLRAAGDDMGIIWDRDFNRCFFGDFTPRDTV